MNDRELVVLQKCAKSEPDRKAIAELCQKTRKSTLAPAAGGLLFSIPQLEVRDDNRNSLFEDQFRDTDWDIAAKDPILHEKEFVLPRTNMQTGLVDIDAAGKLQASFVTELQHQVALFDYSFKTTTELVAWLAKTIAAPDIKPSQKETFLLALVKSLIDLRGYNIEQLITARFSLADSAARRIDTHRRDALRESFQKFFLGDFATPLEVTAQNRFDFPLRSVYPAASIYAGNIKFHRHYYQNIADMNGEESKCALLIDSHPKVKFWVRNLERPDFAFWLPTSSDRFYPDFVAQLTDGRYLACEYKGGHLLSNDDTKEKKAIGDLWEARSNGTCLFRLVSQQTIESFIASL